MLIIKNLKTEFSGLTEDLSIPMSSDQNDFLAKDKLAPGLVSPTMQTHGLLNAYNIIRGRYNL